MRLAVGIIGVLLMGIVVVGFAAGAVSAYLRFPSVAPVDAETHEVGSGASGSLADSSNLNARATADEILKAAGVRGGLIVHLGASDPELTLALCAGSGFLVHALCPEIEQAAKARDFLLFKGIYGQVSVEVWKGPRLPYADNSVNLVVIEPGSEVVEAEVLRVLAPLGAAYYRGNSPRQILRKPQNPETDEWPHFLYGPENNAVSKDRLVGPPYQLQWVSGPRWTRSHDHLASVSAVVAAGGRIFSIVDEAPTAFVVIDSQWSLVAQDAFNGLVLWKRPVGPWEWHLRGFRSGPPELPRSLVAEGDRVYAILGYGKPACALDAATGEILMEYAGTEGAAELVLARGVLYVVAGVRRPAAWDPSLEAWRRGVTPSPEKKRIHAVEVATGRTIWVKSDATTEDLMPTTLAVSGDRVFFQNPEYVVCLEAGSGQELWRASRPVARSRFGWSTPTLVVYEDVVISADRNPTALAGDLLPPEKGVLWLPSSNGGNAPPGEMIAFSVQTGERLWSAPSREGYNAPVDVLVVDGLVWTGSLVHAKDPGMLEARDVRTGEVRRQRPPDQQFFTVGMSHHRCYRNKATPRFIILGRAGVEFLDVLTGEATADHWLRGTCQYGVLPANGLLYVPPHSCACYIYAKLSGFNALSTVPALEPGEIHKLFQPSDQSQLELGPASAAASSAGLPARTGPKPAEIPSESVSDRSTVRSEIPAERISAEGLSANRISAERISAESMPAENTEDWPTYRHDGGRSGFTRMSLHPPIEGAWAEKLPGKPTGVVVSRGVVLVAVADQHTVYALDADTGRKLWYFVAGGRVDSPPTIHEDRAIFGSADGCVYCVRLVDGQLVWRFRAAPLERRIVAYGQLESTWPVHGSVLVHEGEVYFAAGRSSFVDGGVFLYRLEAASGRLLSAVRIDGRDPITLREPQRLIQSVNMEGVMPDVMSTDGTSIFMRHARFDRALNLLPPTEPHLFSSAGFLDDSWWHRTYWQFGRAMNSGYGGWPVVGNQVPAGRILVYDGKHVFGFGREVYAHHGSHVGLDSTTIYHWRPAEDFPSRFTQYQLFAAEVPEFPEVDPRRQAPRAGQAAKTAQTGAQMPQKPYRWRRPVPLLVRAMILTGRTLWVAGPRDSADPAGLLDSWTGRRGVVLAAVDADKGEVLAEYELLNLPVFDGLAAASGKLYLSLQDGRILCWKGTLQAGMEKRLEN